ncbi:hypothetical protein Agabi119p4_7483 [Agaricus bisporus var. burnettii]|uniref:AN1-type domain-containing protein n=1 Tax=Agaricus bisporus var. burnettii TaxID=192524 RepID=A0A8H7C8B1_AGABI|nr:hypothetical protein Agabi119p4_7483 [Agaricus bisporus var. burnettii]
MTTPASRATPAPERDTQLLSIGKQCAEQTCQLIDFLPFKCHHCNESYCQDHFKVEAHKCPQYDESKHNRVAPNCPLCNTPIAIPPGQDPNVRMERHLTVECSVMTGRAQKKSSPVCARSNCKKILFAPISCTQCHAQFCPSHRFPADHACSAPISKPSASASKTAGSRLLNEFSGNKLNDKASAATSAVKKTVSSASTSVSKSIASAKASASGTGSSEKATSHGPFSKVDSVLSPLLFSTTVNFNCSMTITDAKHDNDTMPHKRESFAPPALFASA